MLRIWTLLSLLLMSFPLKADQIQDLKNTIALQRAEMSKQADILEKINAKLNKFIDDEGTWKGKNSGLQGPEGPRGPTGPDGPRGPQGAQGDPGPGNMVSWVINELNSCNTYCNHRGYFCLATTFANWNSGTQAQCSTIAPSQKRCLCAQ